MNKEISPELAYLLKDKGINIYPESEYRYTDFNGIARLEKNASEIFPYAPTVDEVKWWFYEKHGIWINVYYKPKYKSWDYEYTNINWSQEEVDKKLKEDIDNVLEDIFNSKIKYNSPTEAYEAAIKYTLENLI
jgi:hypothetical protein